MEYVTVTTLEEALLPSPRLEERVVSDSVAWQGRVFSAGILEVELSDGRHEGREIAWHNGGAGVVAIQEGCVCLVRQYRVALGRVTVEIPAGRLDSGETPVDCAARELVEETGLVAGSLERVAVTRGSPGFTSERTDVFLARDLTQRTPRPDEGEVVDVVWVPVAEVVAGIRSGRVQDAKTVAGVLAAVCC